jgi:hypothetical protein
MRRPYPRLAAAIASVALPAFLIMLVTLVMLVMSTDLRADGPADNLPAAVRPIPPVGIELDDAVCASHPFVKHAFPSLWDRRWVAEFTKAAPAGPTRTGEAQP